MPIVILLPIFCGALVPVLPFKSRRQMEFYIETAVILNSVLVVYMLFHRPDEVFHCSGRWHLCMPLNICSTKDMKRFSLCFTL